MLHVSRTVRAAGSRAGGLTLAHLRGSTDYRSCQHLAQRSVLAQSNGSPKTSVSTPLERCWHTLRVKPGYTCKKPGIPEKYLGPRQCRARPLPGPLRQLRLAPPAQVRAPHHVRSLQVLKAASALRQARLAGGGADDAVVPTFCFKIEAVLGMRFCEPEQLIAKKRRNRLAAADKARCYLTRGTFKEDSIDAGFIDTRWVELEELYENCGKTPLKNALKKYRKAEEEDVDAAIADFEEGVEHEG